MRTLFARYDILIEEPGEVPRQAMQAAQEAISYTVRELTWTDRNVYYSMTYELWLISPRAWPPEMLRSSFVLGTDSIYDCGRLAAQSYGMRSTRQCWGIY